MGLGGQRVWSAQRSTKLAAVWCSCEARDCLIQMENTEQNSLIALLSNLVLFLQTFTARDRQTSKQTGASNIQIPEVLLSQFGSILEEKCQVSEPSPGNITQLFFREDSKGIVMEHVTSVLKETMERESREGNNSTIIIETLIEYFFSKLSDKQKREAEAELLAEGNENGMFYERLLIDIFKINETIAKTKSHRKFIRKSYERFSEFFPQITDQQIAQHDLSKFDFVELIGYTAR